MPTVFHFVRRYLHYTATFIGNQISNHKNYHSVLFYKEHIPNPAFTFANIFNIDDSKKIRSVFHKLIYKISRHITRSQVNYILKRIDEEKPNILHFHYGTDAGMFYKILKKARVPKVVSFYGWDYSYFPKRYFGIGKKYLQKRVFEHADLILAMSMNMKKALISLGARGEKIKIHYHGLDTSLFNIERDYAEKDEVNIYLLSSLEPKKGHLFLLKALKRSIEKTSKPLKLHFTGKFGKFSSINNSIKKLGLEKNVIWHAPYQYGSERHLKMLSKADFFVHPSITDKKGNKEGIPGTLLEAMSSGLAVISTYHAGIPEIITDGQTGFLVKEWDIEALSEKIILLADNHKLRKEVGLRAKEYAVANLDIHKKQKELEGIYESLVLSPES
ncbi:MAG: glycosyltransferase family 4 protein [Bacteroidetes bacterium]|nr:glycosyltransferase family 4 protein [Bacteroidota bacterium]